MKERIRAVYNSSTLASKIRYSYLLLLIPIVMFLIFCFVNMWTSNQKYEDMINSTVVASEFSLDFKKDFDYETYLVIVGNKTIEESTLREMLSDAGRIVTGLDKLTNSKENSDRLKSAKKYLSNLTIYIDRIEQNLQEGNKYEDNIEIWEHDVQIVTSLLRETIFQYIYYEVKDIQEARTEYQNFFMVMIRFSIIAFAAILILIVLLSYYIPLSITRPIRKLSEVTDQVAKGDLTVRSDIRTGAEVGMLSDSLNTMIDKINELLEQVKKEQIRLRKAEFELLQSQINPHFLYNTLDTLNWKAVKYKDEDMENLISSLCDFYRISLSDGNEFITIEQELHHVQSYINIQSIRFKNLFRYTIDCPDELMNYYSLKVILQPLVENAITHGLRPKGQGGLLNISIIEQGKDVVVYVNDNGVGMDESTLSEVLSGLNNIDLHKYGLYNVNQRIRLTYGEGYGINIESEPGKGTCVKVVFPKFREGDI